MASEIGAGVEVIRRPGSFGLKLPCGVCHKNLEFLFNKNYPPNVLRKKLQQRGWNVGRNLVCPSCVKLRPNAQKRTLMTGTSMGNVTGPDAAPVKLPAPQPQPTAAAPAPVQQEQEQVASKPVTRSLQDLGDLLRQNAENAPVQAEPKAPALPVPTPAPAKPDVAQPAAPQPVAVPPVPTTPAVPAAPPTPTTPPTPQQHRAAMELLEQHFNGATGKWLTPGYNDAKVAAASGANQPYVTELRLTWFGPEASNPEAEILLDELAQLSTQQQRLERQYAQAAQAAKQEARQGREEVDQFRKDSEAQAAKMQAVVEQYVRESTAAVGLLREAAEQRQQQATTALQDLRGRIDALNTTLTQAQQRLRQLTQ